MADSKCIFYVIKRMMMMMMMMMMMVDSTKDFDMS